MTTGYRSFICFSEGGDKGKDKLASVALQGRGDAILFSQIGRARSVDMGGRSVEIVMTMMTSRSVEGSGRRW